MNITNNENVTKLSKEELEIKKKKFWMKLIKKEKEQSTNIS